MKRFLWLRWQGFGAWWASTIEEPNDGRVHFPYGFRSLRQCLYGLGLRVALCALLLFCGGAHSATRSTMVQEFEGVYYPLTTLSTACTDIALNAAITSMQAMTPPRTILQLTPVDGAGLACTWTLGANVTVPRGITLRIPDGARVSVSAGQTLTINGPLFAEDPGWYSGAGAVVRNYRPWETEGMSSFVAAGCAPTVPGASLTLGAFSCRAHVQEDGQWNAIWQASAAVGPLNVGDGAYWLAAHRDTSTALSGWTRQVGTHYLWRLSATYPAVPSGGIIVAKVTVSAGAISARVLLAPYRSSASALQRVLNIRDFGAVCDGVVDDTAAIQATFDAITGPNYAVYIPPAGDLQFCKLTAAITMPAAMSGITIFGVGHNMSRVRQTTAGADGLVVATGTTMHHFRDFHIDGINGPRFGINMSSATVAGYNTIEGMRIDGFAGTNGAGIYTCNQIVVKLWRSFLNSNRVGLREDACSLAGVALQSGPNAWSIEGNHFSGNTEYGVRVYAWTGVAFQGNDVESNQLGGVLLETAPNTFSASGNYFEQNLTLAGGGGYFDILVGSAAYGQGCIITGNHFNGRVTGETADYIPVRLMFANGCIVEGNSVLTGNKFIKVGANATYNRIGVNAFRSTVNTSLPSLFEILGNFVHAGNSLRHLLIPVDPANWFTTDLPGAMTATLLGGSSYFKATESTSRYAGRPVTTLARSTGSASLTRVFPVSATNGKTGAFLTVSVPVLAVTGSPQVRIALDDSVSVVYGEATFYPVAADEYELLTVNGFVPAGSSNASVTIELLANNTTIRLARPRLVVGLDIALAGDAGSIRHEGTAAPTTGTWEQGDVVWNTTPSGATPVVLWLNTVGGSPGTWISLLAN